MDPQLLRNSLKWFVAALLTAAIASWSDRLAFVWYPLLAVVIVVDDDDDLTVQAVSARILGTGTPLAEVQGLVEELAERVDPAAPPAAAPAADPAAPPSMAVATASCARGCWRCAVNAPAWRRSSAANRSAIRPAG